MRTGLGMWQKGVLVAMGMTSFSVGLLGVWSLFDSPPAMHPWSWNLFWKSYSTSYVMMLGFPLGVLFVYAARRSKR